VLVADPPQCLLDLPGEQDLLQGFVARLGGAHRDTGPRGARAAEVDHHVAQDREQPGSKRSQLRVEALACPPGA